MLCYHRTAAANEIVAHGFRDGAGYYLTNTIHEGVWLADRPLNDDEGAKGDDLLGVVIPDELLAQYEWVEETKPYREFLVPAAVVNEYGPPRFVDEDQLFLVACCGPKLAKAARAADLYISALFKKARAFAEKRGRWMILSARYGLLEPTMVIRPYDVTLKKLPASKRRAWGIKVRKQLEARDVAWMDLIALAGADYVNPLIDAGFEVSQPMKGLPIGKQLQWLNNQDACSDSAAFRPVAAPRHR
jgi:hypothetical protein